MPKAMKFMVETKSLSMAFLAIAIVSCSILVQENGVHIVSALVSPTTSRTRPMILPTLSSSSSSLPPSSPPFPSPLSSSSLSMTATSTTTTTTASSSKSGSKNLDSASDVRKDTQYTRTDTVICGAGPAGLLTAIMLAQKFPDQKIKIYDRLSQPPASPTDETVWNVDVAKFYLIGLGGRAQISLGKFGLWDAVESVCSPVVGRKDWAPGSSEGVERVFEGRKFLTQVLPRDKLVAVLYKYISDNFSMGQIEFHHGFEVRPVSFGGELSSDDTTDSAVVDIFHCNGQTEQDLSCTLTPIERVSTNLLVAADGAARTVANMMEQTDKDHLKKTENNPIIRLFKKRSLFKVTRFEDDNQRVYKTIPIKLPKGWRPDLNYSARSKGGGMNIDCLPATSTGDYCGVLLLRKDDPLAQADVDPAQLRSFMDEYLPQFSEILDDDVVARVAKKPPSFLPAFRFVGPRLNMGDHTLILGDAAHTVKPYFGLGAATALEDVAVLADCIDDTATIQDAVHEFSNRRSKDAETLVRISRDLDRPGVLGTITFIIPIILDSIFNKINPKLFAPNVISMLQREDLTFTQVAKRKRIDRIAQLSVVGTILTVLGAGTKILINTIARILGRKPSTVGATLAVSVVAFNVWKNVLAKRTMQLFDTHMAPADILAKLKSKITNQKETVN